MANGRNVIRHYRGIRMLQEQIQAKHHRPNTTEAEPMTAKAELKPTIICPACGTNQVQVIEVDRKNPGRNIYRCRHCKTTANGEMWPKLFGPTEAVLRQCPMCRATKCLMDEPWAEKIAEFEGTAYKRRYQQGHKKGTLEQAEADRAVMGEAAKLEEREAILVYLAKIVDTYEEHSTEMKKLRDHDRMFTANDCINVLKIVIKSIERRT